MDHAGTLIVGGGLAGSATAMHLAERGADGVVVVDPDLAGVRSSSELNAGGVRATWWRPVNVELCAATIAFFAEHREEFAFRERGYLWLHGPGRWEQAVAHVAMQNAFGRRVELLGPAEVARRWPVIDRVDDLAGATFSPRDGLVSPNAVKEHYRARARAAGARFVDRRALVGVRREGPRVTAVTLRALDGAGAERTLEGHPAGRPAGGHDLRAHRQRRRPVGGAGRRPDRACRSPAARSPASSAWWPRATWTSRTRG